MGTLSLIVIAVIAAIFGVYGFIRRAAILAITQQYDTSAKLFTFPVLLPFIIAIGCIVWIFCK